MSQFATSKDKDENLMSQFVTSSWGGRRKLPFAFTEHGVIMIWQRPAPDTQNAV